MTFVQTSFQEERAAHEVESGVWQRMLRLGRSAFGAWLGLFGDGDAGDLVVLDDGCEVRRREYRSVFGPFELNRSTRYGKAGRSRRLSWMSG